MELEEALIDHTLQHIELLALIIELQVALKILRLEEQILNQQGEEFHTLILIIEAHHKEVQPGQVIILTEEVIQAQQTEEVTTVVSQEIALLEAQATEVVLLVLLHLEAHHQDHPHPHLQEVVQDDLIDKK